MHRNLTEAKGFAARDTLMHGCGHGIGLRGNFKPGNQKLPQTETCQTRCRVSSSSQCHFMACLCPIWANSLQISP